MKTHTTRIDAVIQTVRSRIASRDYVPGTRLPSVRAQAKAMSLSVSTVFEAYERMTAEGVVVARPGSGFYVAGPVAPLSLTGIGPKLDREIDPLWISRQSLEAEQSVLRPGCGWLPPSWMFEEGVRRGLRTAARSDSAVLSEYATPLGHSGLHQVLTRRMASLGIEAGTGQVMLTDSGTHAIDLVCRFLLEPGDTVLVDDPCYFNFHALLKAHRVKAVGIPYTPSGPDLDCFDIALHEHSPRLYITNSGIHNPTGSVLTPVVAHKLLKLAENSNLVIVEDDIFADFELNPAPRLAAFDGLSKVIHISSFSKTVSASLRCGYIAARSDWIEDLTDLKIATSFGGGRLAAEVMLTALTDSGYRKHMETVRLRLSRAMESAVAQLGMLDFVPWLIPQSGMFVWCRIPQGTDATLIARSCLRNGVVVAPGSAFSQSRNAGDFMRFNVAQSEDERVFKALRKAISEQQ